VTASAVPAAEVGRRYGLIREAMARDGLDADPEDLIDHAARPDVAYDHKASMLQDVEARRPTEIDYLNGGIVRFGEAHRVPTPLNRAIWALVQGLERSW